MLPFIIPATTGKHRIIRQFQQHGATSAAKARTLDELKVRRSPMFKRLMREGIIKHEGSERYYLDLRSFESFSAQKKRFVIIMLFLMLISFLFIFLYNYYSSK